MEYLPDQELQQLAEQIIKDGKQVKMTPKKLLDHFGTSRRKTHVKSWIDKWLRDSNLQTIPDYKTAYLYGEIYLQKQSGDAGQEDFVQRVKLLEAANKEPKSVTKNDSIEKAMTIMMANDYSQLPVMNNSKSKKVDGMISWHSIGWATAKGINVEKVHDAMNTQCTIIQYDTPILEAIHKIKEDEVVLIQKVDQTISGLLTMTDIADAFFETAVPFLLIGQIETSIRVLLEGKFSSEQLVKVKFGDDDRSVSSVSDLNFSEYIELLRSGDNWGKLELPLDKAEFTKQLDKVRKIRNDVMHFSSDKLEADQHDTLTSTALFLKEVLTK